MNFHFILLAGGIGSRMGSETPKQFLFLKDKPLICHSIEAFLQWTAGKNIIVVSHPDYLNKTRATIEESFPNETLVEKNMKIVAGGSTRHQSGLRGIQAALEFSDPEDVLFLHDAARPFIEPGEFERLAQMFKENSDCLVASLADLAKETIVRGSGLPGTVTEYLDRAQLFVIKTPQGVRVSALKKMLAVEETKPFTDLLGWADAASIKGHIVPSGTGNRKITVPEDIV